MVSNMAGNVYMYGNIDNNLNGCFTLLDSVYHPAESNRIKYNLTVSGGDLNGDNLSDLIIGHATGGAHVFYMHDPFVSVQEVKMFVHHSRYFQTRLLLKYVCGFITSILMRIQVFEFSIVLEKKFISPVRSMEILLWKFLPGRQECICSN